MTIQPRGQRPKCEMTCNSCDMDEGWREWCTCDCHGDEKFVPEED